MLTPAEINIKGAFYPVGDTPAICLTQSMPPGEATDVLLLGCGDVRNILFTNHVNSRRLDVTCCDREKGIIARNILLLSLMIDDKDGENDDVHWAIYYNMFHDDETRSILRTQAEKLCKLSVDMEAWRNCRYGSHLSFCDSATLSDVRKMWRFYSEEHSEGSFQRHFESIIGRAKATRRLTNPDRKIHFACSRPATPVEMLLMDDLEMLNTSYWEYGGHKRVESQNSKSRGFPNPTFLADEGEKGSELHYNIDPLLGFHLAPACLLGRTDDEQTILLKRLDKADRIMKVAHTEFGEWAESYRKGLNAVTTRFCCGDAISFAHTLQNKRITAANTANWYRDRYGFQPLVLDGPDYRKNIAPLKFDVIDTSNLANHLGPLTLLAAASPLLRDRLSSVLYTEYLQSPSEPYWNHLDHMLCGRVPTLSTLLGLFPVEYWTHTSSISVCGEIKMIKRLQGLQRISEPQIYLRISWRRSLSLILTPDYCSPSMSIKFDPDGLATLLYRIFESIFVSDECIDGSGIATTSTYGSPNRDDVLYTRASFVSLLRIVRGRVTCDWDMVMSKFVALIDCTDQPPIGEGYLPEFYTFLHIAGLFSSHALWDWHKRKAYESIGGEVSQTLPPRNLKSKDKKNVMIKDIRSWREIPTVVCITLRIPRKDIAVITGADRFNLGKILVHCSLRNGGLGRKKKNTWSYTFPTCQLAFGQISTRGERDSESYEVCVTEDEDGWIGTGALIAAFYMPASVLLDDMQALKVGFGIHNTPKAKNLFSAALNDDLILWETPLSNTVAVHITRYAPHQAGFPILTGFAQTAPAATPVNTIADTSLVASVDEKEGSITNITGRIQITCPELKEALENGCSVKRTIISPCEVAIQIGETVPSLRLYFPVYVERGNQKTRSNRRNTVSCILVTMRVAGVWEWANYPEHMCLIHMDMSSNGSDDGGKQPVNWNMGYLTLARCPVISITHGLALHMMTWITDREIEVLALQRSGRKLPIYPVSNGEVALAQLRAFMGNLFLKIEIGKWWMRTLTVSDPATGVPEVLWLIGDLRLNLADRTVIVDCAIVPLPLPGTEPGTPLPVIVLDVNDVDLLPDSLRIWRRMQAAAIERCRTWSHRAACEYAVAGVVPIATAATAANAAGLCSCGRGVFGNNFLLDGDVSDTIPGWAKVRPHAIRAALSLPFQGLFAPDDPATSTSRFVVDCNSREGWYICPVCSKGFHEGRNAFIVCIACGRMKYCSEKCRDEDCKHERLCSKKKI